MCARSTVCLRRTGKGKSDIEKRWHPQGTRQFLQKPLWSGSCCSSDKLQQISARGLPYRISKQIIHVGAILKPAALLGSLETNVFSQKSQIFLQFKKSDCQATTGDRC